MKIKITSLVLFFVYSLSYAITSNTDIIQADSYTVAYESSSNSFDITINDTTPAGATYVGFFANNATTSSSQEGNNNITLVGTGLNKTITYDAPAGFSGSDSFSYRYFDASNGGVGDFQVTITVCPDIDDSAISASSSVSGDDVVWTLSAPSGITVRGTSSNGGFAGVNGSTITITDGALITSPGNTLVLDDALVSGTPTCINDFADKTYKYCPVIDDNVISANSAEVGNDVVFTLVAPSGVWVDIAPNSAMPTGGSGVNGSTVTFVDALLSPNSYQIQLTSSFLVSDNSCINDFADKTIKHCVSIDDSAISLTPGIDGNGNATFTVVAPAGISVDTTSNGVALVNGDVITITNSNLTAAIYSVTLTQAYLTGDNTCLNDFADKTYNQCIAPLANTISVTPLINGDDLEWTISAPANVTVVTDRGSYTNGQSVTLTDQVPGKYSITLESAHLTSDITCANDFADVTDTICRAPFATEVDATAAVVGDDIVFTISAPADVTVDVTSANGSVSLENGGTVTFTDGNLVHSVDFSVTLTDTYLTSDNSCTTDIDPDNVITFTVPRSNHPTAVDDVYEIDQTLSREIKPLTRDTNDSDPNGLALSIKSINGVALTGGVQTIAVTDGTVNIDADNKIFMVPDLTLRTSLSFPYVIINTNNYEDDGTVTINIDPLNNFPTTPTAVDDAYILDQARTIVLEPLTKGDNDSDPNDLALSIVSINGEALTGAAQTIIVSCGIVDIDANGGITFTGEANTTGACQIPYAIENILGDQVGANINLTINPNSAPVGSPTATDDVYEMDQGDSIKLRPLTKDENDSDPNDLDLSIVSINGVTLTGAAQTITDGTSTIDIDTDGEITYSPGTAVTGLVTYAYTIENTNNLTATANQIITVNPVAGVTGGPSATDDNYTVDQGGTIELRPLTKGANDSDPNGLDLSIVSINGDALTGAVQTITVQNGTVAIDANGVITFASSPSYFGTVMFNYVIENTNNETATASEIIIVNEVVGGATAPTATDDVYTMDQGETIQIRPLTKGTNDSDPNDITLTITEMNSEVIDYNNLPQTISVGVVNDPDGTITFNAADDITYTAIKAGAPTSFSYEISNGTETATANQLITVNAVTNPTNVLNATDDIYAMDQGETIRIRPLTKGENDSDPNDLPLSITEINSVVIDYNNLPQTITIGLVNDPDGTVTVEAADDIEFNAIKSGSISFSYEISNGSTTASANQIIAVTAVAPGSTAPTATDDVYSMDQGETIAIRPLTKGTNDSDPNDATLTVTEINGEVIDYNNLPQTIIIGAVNDPDGTVTVNAADDITYNALKAGAPTSFSYEISNGSETATANQLITVNAVANPNPSGSLNATDDVYSMDQGETITIRPLTKGENDSDPNDLALSITEINGVTIDYNNLPQTIGIGAVNDLDGNVIVTAADDITYTAIKSGAPTQFSYEISNGSTTASANQIITVNAVVPGSTAPTATDDSYTMDQGETITIRPLTKGTNDSDPNDAALTLTEINGVVIDYNNLPQPITIGALNDADGTVTVNAADDITYTAIKAGAPTSFSYEISNGSETATANQLITVNAVVPGSTAPTATDDSYSMDSDETREIYPLTRGVNDSDPNDLVLTITEIADVTIDYNNLPQTFDVLINGNSKGSITFTSAEDITFTPSESGTLTFPYVIENANGETATANQIIIIAAARTRAAAPIAVDDEYTTTKNTKVAINPLSRGVADNDPSGDNIRLTLINGEEVDDVNTRVIDVFNGKVDFSNLDNITFTPKDGYVGTVMFSYQISNDQQLTDTGIQTINVQSAALNTENFNLLKNELGVYPNPSNGNLKVALNSNVATTAKITLSNLLGKTIYQAPVNLTSGQNNLDLNLNVKPGVMFLRISTSEGSYKVKKVIFK